VARGSAFIRSVALVPERVAQPDAYPFSIPAVKALRQGELELDAGLMFPVGENGSGKSTLIEAVAVAAGFNPEGGSTGFAFSTRHRTRRSTKRSGSFAEPIAPRPGSSCVPRASSTSRSRSMS
jgi:predicted ATPase